MATTALPYSSVLALFAGEGLDYLAGDIGAALCTASYVPSRTGHATLADITNEVTDLSYARVLLSGKLSDYDDTTRTLTLSCDDTNFATLTASGVRYVIFAKIGASDALSPLIGYWDLGTSLDASVNDFVVMYNASGFIQIQM